MDFWLYLRRLGECCAGSSAVRFSVAGSSYLEVCTVAASALRPLTCFAADGGLLTWVPVKNWFMYIHPSLFSCLDLWEGSGWLCFCR